MVKKSLFLLLTFWTATLTCALHAVGQCVNTPNSGANFRLYDVATKQQVQTLCVGRQVRLKDASGRQLDPAQIYYQKTSALVCSGFTDTSTFYTPAAAGKITITQNTQNPLPNSSGLIFGREYEVKAAPPPAFEVVSCASGSVQLTVTDQTYDQYSVTIGGVAVQPNPRPNAPVTYATNGATAVTLTGSYNSPTLCSNQSTKTFTSLPAPQRPTIQRLTAQNNGSVELQFAALQPEYKYALQLSEGPAGYRTVATVAAPVAGYSVPNTPKLGCYRLVLTDACQASVVLSSADVCSVSLTAASLNGRNRLTWTTSQAGTFEVSRNGQVLVQLPAGTTQYEDTNVTCGVAYTYRVTALNGSVASVSNEAVVTTASTLTPATPQLTASFNLRNQVVLTTTTPLTPTGGQLLYLRNGSELRTTASRTLLDSTLTLGATPQPVCYTVRFLDECGNRSAESAPVCPVLLTATAANEDGTLVRLSWTALRGPDPAALPSYRVQILSPNNTVLGTIAAGLSLTLPPFPPLAGQLDQQELRYRIEAIGSGLASPSYSNIATITRSVKLFVPTAFTPNGDGLNDVLELKGRYLNNFRFVIIDRNGQEVFRATTRAQTWDGRIGSASPVPGAYVWRFEANDQSGQRVAQHGTVTILR
ncbi:gliding motility-associated C-terminal domain-containing protein [Hymenobacter gelipurpurascens]|uniref:Gliding motility-associated C-terminal domain-containing protein n=1 Tax=Hymenobacter gelipurpurascens TaxID=89968 RepID=A0A212TGG2_9BACT|nr:gliding motility-associated C-terminal domain-containing protein [Hymenobacter gelipurpurascens]SNC65093.1 gliding motility-associated C-terminal domain-containing protein [Hymenobacter gelipurpurascens]